MSDPVTHAEAIGRLRAAWAHVNHYRHPTPTTIRPAPAYGLTAPAHELRAHVTMLGRPDDRPPAPPEVTALRDEIARALGAWYRHPVTRAIRGRFTGGNVDPAPVDLDSLGWVLSRRWTPDYVAHVSPEADLADLEHLPAAPAERAVTLAASAYTARQERDWLTANAEGARAREAKQRRETAATYAEHHDRAVAMLPDAFGAWWPGVGAGIEAAALPVVPAYPTVAATARPSGYIALGGAI